MSCRRAALGQIGQREADCANGRSTGRTAIIESLTGSLVVDDREIRRRLGWRQRLDLAALSRFDIDGRHSDRSGCS